MKGLTLGIGLTALACLTMLGMAQNTASEEAPDTLYTYQTVNYPGDTFTQLLGINNAGTIVGYHGDGVLPAHPFSGFRLTLPQSFTTENVPGAVQTQVIGINNNNNTDGFWIDGTGANHGFLRDHTGAFTTVDFPATTSSPKVNQLLGLNTVGQLAGFYNDKAGLSHGYIWARFGGVFSVFTIPVAVKGAQATGVNNAGQVCGFYVDAAGNSHGFVLSGGTFTTINYPLATSTTIFGENNNGVLVGTYTDSAGKVHGFVHSAPKFQTVDDPAGAGATIINGINDNGDLVGFFGSCTTGGLTCEGMVAIPRP